jgi:hypothetical protein
LPEVSQKISNSINSATDALIAALVKLPESDKDDLLHLFQEHLPQTVSDIAFNRVKDAVPDQYIINAIASRLASKMVYKGKFEHLVHSPILTKIIILQTNL